MTDAGQNLLIRYTAHLRGMGALRRTLRADGVSLLTLALAYAVAMLAFAAGAALLHQHQFISFGVAFGALFGMGGRIVNRYHYWELAPPDRERCDEVVRTGVPAGTLGVDRVARQRLVDRAGASSRVTQTLMAAVLLVSLCVFVAAAVLRSPWWATAAAATVALGWRWWAHRPADGDERRRVLNAFNADMDRTNRRFW